jgi:hypothetical protein
LPPRSGDHADDDNPGEQKAKTGADAKSVEHGEEQHKEKSCSPDASYIGLAARDLGTADDHDGDRTQQIFIADIDASSAEIASKQCSVDAAEGA